MKRTKRSTADLNKTSGPSPTTSILAALMAAPITALADLKSVTPVAEMPVGEPWDSIRALQELRLQVYKFSGALLNAVFTERRAVFPLARRSFEALIRQPSSINHGAISGTDFKDFRAYLVNNGIVRELRPPPVVAKMPGLYILAHPVFAPLLSSLLRDDTMATLEARATAEWDVQLKNQRTRKESSKESTSSLLLSSNLNSTSLSSNTSATQGRAEDPTPTSLEHQKEVQDDEASSMLVKTGVGNARPSLDQILLVEVKKRPTTGKERLDILHRVAKAVRSAGYALVDVSDEFKAAVVAKLIGSKKPKGWLDDAFSTWQGEVHEELREVLEAEFGDGAGQPAKSSSDEPPPRPRTAMGTDLSRILEIVDRSLDSPLTADGPLHFYRRKFPEKFEKNRVRLDEIQIDHVVTQAAQTVRTHWKNLSPGERAKYKWLAADRDLKEILADYKAQSSEESATASDK